MEYVLHDIMSKLADQDMTVMRPFLDAIAEPISWITRRMYAEAEQQDPKAVERKQIEEQLAENLRIIADTQAQSRVLEAALASK